MTKVKTKKVTGIALSMCVLAIVFYYYEYYLRVAPSVMSTELKLTFNLSEAAFGHLAAFFYYAYTPMQIPVGMMMDRYGPRRLLTFACFLCVLGTLMFGMTGELWIAQLGRFLLGFGSAFAYVGVLKLSNVWLPKKYFAFMAGLCTALGMFGGISSAVLISHLMVKIGWQETLYYSSLAGVVLAAGIWFIIRDGKNQEEHEHEIDLTHEVQIKLAGLKQIVQSPQMWISGLIGCLTFLPISGFAEVWAVSYLQTVGMSKFDAASGASMLFLGFAVGAPIWGIISDIIQSRRIPLIIGSFVSAGFMALIVFMPSTSLVWMYALLFLSAFFASAEILIFAVSNDISRHSVSATAIAFTNMVVMVGGVLLPPIIGKILDSAIQTIDNIPVLTVHDFSIALAVLPLGLVLSGILSLCLKESYHRHPKR